MQADINVALTLPAQLKVLRRAHGRTLSDLAQRTGLSRLTVAGAEGASDARLSTLSSLLDELGYVLIPVPKPMAQEVASFVNNGARQIALPAGASAPLSIGQRSFLEDGQSR